MANTYVTKQGQTWDEIALEVYGAEKYADFLMQNNFDKLDILIFSAGTELKTPDMLIPVESDAPIWAASEGEEFYEENDPYA